MKELNCKSCNKPTSCDEKAVAVTCSSCVNEGLSGLVNVLESSMDRLTELV